MFLVIEGIDGAGCETQAKNLVKICKKHPERFFPVELIKYPDYERNVGKLIKEFLYQNKNLSPEQQFLLYTIQFIIDAPMIREKRGLSFPQLPITNYQLPIIIADRYFTTTLCYQTLEGIDLKKALRFASDFKIEKPDLVFYLNVRPEIAIQRKASELKEKNRREKDFDFIKKTYKQYAYLVKNQIWTRWIEIDGERKVDEITKEIFDKIKSKLSLL